MRKTILFLSIIILLFSSYKIVSGFSDDIILTYNGKNKTLKFSNSEALFSDFKELMPGDTVTQKIKIKGKNISVNTKFYLKLTISQNNELFKDMKFNIYVDNKKIETKIADSYVKLLEIDKNNEYELKIELDIPTNVGNEISELEQQINWDFIISENGEVIDPPQTGDNIIKYVFLFVISLMILVYTVIMYINNKKKIINKIGG